MRRFAVIARGLRCLSVAGVLAVSVLVGSLVAAVPAQAITNGQPDGNRHPNVGLMVVTFPGSGPQPWCTGTLIAPTYFLTAAHCVVLLQQFGGTVTGVTFDPTPALGPGGSPVIAAQATAVDPGFGHDQGDYHDLAVITLASAAPAAPAALPTAGLLDRLAAQGGLRGQQFTNVGYGAIGIAHGGGRPVPILDFERRFSTSPFMALRNTVLFLLLNANATGQGGTCAFDSGSPHFLNTGSGDVLVALTSLLGDRACAANGFNYLLDTPSARAFLGQFVTLP